MGFLWTTIHVKNLEESIAFYQAIVGLQLRRRFKPYPGRELAFLGVGETEIELMQTDGEDLPGRIEGISIGFSCDDAEELRNELIENQFEVTEIESPNPNLKYFIVKDPDGVNVQFVQDMRKG
jgi:lactoylglutathione lyase